VHQSEVHVDENWTCGECGWTNRGGRFCFECGRDGFPDPVAAQRFPTEPADGEPRWRRPALAAGAVALLVAVGALVAVLLSGGDTSKTAAKVPAHGGSVTARRALTRAQTVDELMKIVVASHAGLAATRKGEWAQAAQNRKGLVGRLDVLATRTAQVEGARKALASALEASERADAKSLACKDKTSVSACAAPAHQRATKLKERFRLAFNKILSADGRKPVPPNSF
jgi:hypothetical protein